MAIVGSTIRLQNGSVGSLPCYLRVTVFTDVHPGGLQFDTGEILYLKYATIRLVTATDGVIPSSGGVPFTFLKMGVTVFLDKLLTHDTAHFGTDTLDVVLGKPVDPKNSLHWFPFPFLSEEPAPGGGTNQVFSGGVEF